ncbi:chondroitin sulfate proteoglycan 4-like [Salmo trutta]|uniref:chondroitin sulfate proteoglycan 4-like n=1 Tax=Salmo trutta TaxID=8032 RepID=UPI001131E61B|nr:chondroitin sulfate proteoglycan 4-like [Salmo trutta]
MGDSVTIHYTVTTPPHHGSLLMSDLPVSEFNQEDLHSGRLSYHMTDLTSSSDSFEFTVLTAESNLTAVTVVTVRPFIHLSKRLLIPSCIAVKLRKDAMDTTELAALSGSDPVFHNLSPPKHGKLVTLPWTWLRAWWSWRRPWYIKDTTTTPPINQHLYCPNWEILPTTTQQRSMCPCSMIHSRSF